MAESSEDGPKWLNERFARFADRVERIEADQKSIRDNIVWLVRIGVLALITLAGHAAVSYIQMSGP